MKHYKLKLTALTPIHIGTGEVYEPTNFVVDGGYLYEFDEIEFYNKLQEDDKKIFVSLAEKTGYESLFELHKFIKERKELAKKAYINKVQVTKAIQTDYDNKIGRVVQNEGRRTNIKKVFNKFEIERTIRLNNNSNKVYIPGSSLKGAISTAYQEYTYKQNEIKYEQYFKKRNPSENLFKKLSISDAAGVKSYSIIGYALNKERFEEDNLGPNIKLETIFSNAKQQSIFETVLSIKEEFLDLDKDINIKQIQQACNEHYLPIFKQQFSPYAIFKGKNVDEWTNEYYSDEYYEKYKDFKLKNNQFLIRVGKYSQARAVTIDGMRKIKVKVSGGGPRRKPNKWETLEQETTTWMFGFSERNNNNLLPFGWVLCEVI